MNASDFRSLARQKLEGNWMTALAATFIASLLGATITLASGGNSYLQLTKQFGEKTPKIIENHLHNPLFQSVFAFLLGAAAMGVVISIIRYVIGSFISLGLIQFNLDLIDGKNVEVGTIFSRSAMIGKAFWLRLRMGIFTTLWTLLFIIPGIIKAYAYSMSGFIMAENPQITAKEAMTISMDMMNGNKLRMFCLELSFIGWSLLCGLTLGIGLLWLNPYKNAALTEFYNEISRDYQRIHNQAEEAIDHYSM